MKIPVCFLSNYLCQLAVKLISINKKCMKKLWLFIFIVTGFTAMAQPSVKIYAYSQETTPGIIPKDVSDENGKPVSPQKEARVNYYFFAACSPSAKINFPEVWINGKYFKVQTSRVDSTPVVMTNNNIPNNPVKEILVPVTRLRVISIVPIGTPGTKNIRSAWFRTMLNKSALIISYLYKDKKYFLRVKKIKPLLPVAGI